jgi:hypothetical protein
MIGIVDAREELDPAREIPRSKVCRADEIFRSSGILEGADGVRQTVVELPETGEYVIQIGTDETASYSLEITIN